MLRRALAFALWLPLIAISGVGGTWSTYTRASSRTQTLTTPPLKSVGLATAQSADAVSYSITGVSPGGVADYLLNIRNDGTSPPDIATLVRTSSATLLDTDATNGLHVEVDKCSAVWQQSAIAATATCNATQTTILASTALATLNAASATLTSSGLASLSSGGLDHLRVHFSLPSGAPASYSTLTSTPTVTIYGWGLPGAPTGLTATAGDGQVTVSWSAPSSTGASAITGYTATASPGGATCTTTSATTCTITGLTDGTSESISVTATNTQGTGSASSAASAIPYPSSIMASGHGLTLWLDGADASTELSSSTCTGATAASGGSVGCWTDKSGKAANFSQATSTAQPVTATLNGQGAVDFTSNTQNLNSTTSTNTYQTVFIAVLPQTTPTGWDYLFGLTGSDTANIRLSTTNFASPNSSDWAYNAGATALDWSSGRQATEPTLGATTIITAQSSSAKTGSVSLSTTVIGNSGSARGTIGYYGEVVAFSGTLTTAQRRTVEDYLARKWGVTMTPDPPGTPTATAGTKSATVSWSAPSWNGGAAVSGYTVTSSPGSFTCATTSATSCAVSGLTTGTAYTFTVTAANSVGTGSASGASASITAG